ncbi:MAG: penicillin-binding protein activator [Pseudomonadota bacterium]|nr:penicillin-binding protein activator [Pseudomonadota bacterium]
MLQNPPATFARPTRTLSTLLLALVLGGCAMIGAERETDRDLSRAGGYRGGETVAVLLPETGRFASAARTLREGILAAQRADEQGRRPNLRFYDSADDQSAPALVRKAAAEGASLVIGPLQKQAVNQLASGPALPVPTLALNRVSSDRTPPANLYQFSLAPEDEAAEVASKAWAEGYRTAMVLYPEGNWGSRINRGFRQKWGALGGRIAASQIYDPNKVDFSQSVAALMGTSADTAGEGVERTDADFVFLVATSQIARGIWPQIRDQAGSDLPVLSTSHIYKGRFDVKGDLDLVGLYFVDIPWLVTPESSDAASRGSSDEALPRLYAMGVDAYRMAPLLDWMAERPGAAVQGMTGRLSLDSSRRVRRQLSLARMGAGGPVLAESTARPAPRMIVRIGPPEGISPLLAAVGSPGIGAVQP